MEVIVEVEDFPTSETGAPLPLVLATDDSVVLSYVHATVPDLEEPLLYGMIRFRSSRIHLFGAPNDEALEGHPLWSRGLSCYSAFRVEHSSLVRRLEAMNAIHPQHVASQFAGLQHFIVTFHDSTFECVALSAEAVVERMRVEDRVLRMAHYLGQGLADCD